MAGARGGTLKEMAKALHIEGSDRDYHPAASKVLRTLGLEPTAGIALPGVQVAVANRLWAADRFQLSADFTKLTESYYNARAETCHFATNTEDERVRPRRRHAQASGRQLLRRDLDVNRLCRCCRRQVRINRWIESQTNQRIKDLLPPGAINAGTSLVLTNAIYFKGDWTHAFDPKQTSTAVRVRPPCAGLGRPKPTQRDRFCHCLRASRQPFYGFGGERDIRLMYQHREFPYKHLGKVAAIELPYGPEPKHGEPQPAGPQLSMLVLLPEDRSPAGLQDAIDVLREPSLKKLSEQMFSVKVKVGRGAHTRASAGGACGSLKTHVT